MHSFWKVSRGWFSDEHPTEFSGDSVESLNLILLYFRRSSSGSTPCKAVLGSFPQHICSCCSLPTCRQHSWTKYQQDSTGFCDVHLAFSEKLMHSFLYTTLQGMNSSPIILSLSLLPLFNSLIPCSDKCRVCMPIRHPGED